MSAPVAASKKSEQNELIPPRTVDPQQELPALEEEVLARWRERDVFRESLRLREHAPPWIFYEGPPTANGPPGAHHVLSRVFKDIYPRYKTMRGHLVERKGGWDCHGLPVEIAVEQELGISSKAEIEERVGIEAFNAKCRESVFAYVEEWNRLTERIGFWLDLEHAYRTLDETYIESVWWALSEMHRRSLLYEGHKVVPYCYRCGTALSSHEVALGYRDVVDPSIYVRLKALEPSPPAAGGRRAAGLDDHAMDAPGQRGGRRLARPRATCAHASPTRSSCSPRRACRRCSARTPRSSIASPARSSWAPATRDRSSRSATASADARR